ncbi:MAG: hypothetical protein QM804_06450 [Propionicimonas sp.]
MSESDDWFGFGVVAGLEIVKTGNGEVATTAAEAVEVTAGSTVEFEYTITNTGNVPVSGVALGDDVLGSVAAPSGFDGTLAAGESVTFTASGPVALGDYVNVATATGTSGGAQLRASTEWHGVGVPAASASTMSIVKAGNGVVTPTADDAVEVDAGSTVEFEYTVTNTGPAGSAPVTDIELSDSMLGDITDVVSPAGFAGSLAAGESVVFGRVVRLGRVRIGILRRLAREGRSKKEQYRGSVAAPSGFDGTLAAGDSVTFTASGTVGAGGYQNTATATAVGGGRDLIATDSWYALGKPRLRPMTTPTPNCQTRVLAQPR